MTQKFTVTTTATCFFWILLPLSGQNLEEGVHPFLEGTAPIPQQKEARSVPGEVWQWEKAQGAPAEALPVFTSQDSKTLEPRLQTRQGMDEVVDFEVLRKPSPYHRLKVSKTGVAAAALRNDLALISAAYREPGQPESDCRSIGLSVAQRIRLDDSLLLEIVESEIRANPGCACEVVKSALAARGAEGDEVVTIVETAISAAPQMMRLISQCAVATVPDSLSGVQALLARYDIHGGEGGSSAKSSKGAKHADAAAVEAVASIPNPLDFPGDGPVAPSPGGPGGTSMFPLLIPISIAPSDLTDVNP